MWMGEVLAGNLGDTVVMGNLRTLHPGAYRAVSELFVVGAVILPGFAGLRHGYRSGRVSDTVWMGLWSGLVGGALTLATLLAMEAIFRDAIRGSPSVLSEFARSGESDWSRFVYLDALAAGISHLAIGPLLGVAFAGAGGFVGKIARGWG
jgi:hypothetical protein